jgi:hypothetical protein
MGNSRNRYPARRRFLKQSAALSAGAAALATPAIVLGAGRKAGDASVASASSNASVAPPSGTAPQPQHRGGNQRSEAEEQSPHKA